MKIIDLYIHNFGKFHNRHISFDQDINVIYGQNEAGKSTIHTFIRAMLYGINEIDTYTKYEPWNQKNIFKGQLRLEHQGNIYRIERNFLVSEKSLHMVNETLGKAIDDPNGLLKEIMGGISETAYKNTVSIGQLKSAADDGMVAELKKFISNMNTTGTVDLNASKACEFLEQQKKEYENQIVSEASLSYTTVLSEIKKIEKEIASPEYQNLISSIQASRSENNKLIADYQERQTELASSISQKKQILEQNHFTDLASIDAYLQQTEKNYSLYEKFKNTAQKKYRSVFSILFCILGILMLLFSSYLYFEVRPQTLSELTVPCCIASMLCFIIAILLLLKNKRIKKDLSIYSDLIKEIFTRNLETDELTPDTLNLFRNKMQEYKELLKSIDESEKEANHLQEELQNLEKATEKFSSEIEQQNKLQWDLEKKLEHLSGCKIQAQNLKNTLQKNEELRTEIAAIELAIETVDHLSKTIKDSFGLYMNKTASEYIQSITGGIYNSMSIDDELNIFMNTKSKMVPISQVSSGAMDQIYLALRLAAAKLMIPEGISLPLIFDDSFALYDDSRIKTAVLWLCSTFKQQLFIFTCHKREFDILGNSNIDFNLVEL